MRLCLCNLLMAAEPKAKTRTHFRATEASQGGNAGCIDESSRAEKKSRHFRRNSWYILAFFFLLKFASDEYIPLLILCKQQPPRWVCKGGILSFHKSHHSFLLQTRMKSSVLEAAFKVLGHQDLSLPSSCLWPHLHAPFCMCLFSHQPGYFPGVLSLHQMLLLLTLFLPHSSPPYLFMITVFVYKKVHMPERNSSNMVQSKIQVLKSNSPLGYNYHLHLTLFLTLFMYKHTHTNIYVYFICIYAHIHLSIYIRHNTIHVPCK